MHLAGLFEDRPEWDKRLVRDYKPGDLNSLLIHVGDLICNLDMMVVSAKGLSDPERLQYHPAMAQEQLREAHATLLEVTLRLLDVGRLVAAQVSASPALR
jgi:hypothetical protein